MRIEENKRKLLSQEVKLCLTKPSGEGYTEYKKVGERMSGKKKTIIIVALLLVVFIGSISYALWSVTLEQTDSNVVKTGCFTVDMVEETDEINLPEEYPVTDAEGRKYSPFTFTIQNTCTIDSSYSVNLKVEDGTTLEHQYVKAVLDGDKAQVLTDYEKATDEDKYQLTTGTLAGASAEGAGDGESVTYNLRLWLDADTPETQMSKDFYAKIVIENITTSGVVAKEVLASGDISETTSDNVTYTYYSTGELEITGSGRMISAEDHLGALASKIIMNLLSDDEFTATLTSEEQAWLSNEYIVIYLIPTLVDNYEKVFVEVADDYCSSEITDYETYKTCLLNTTTIMEVDDAFISLMDKVNDALPNISSLKISEGITNISNYLLSFITLDEIVVPSTITEVGDDAFYGVTINNLELNDGLVAIGSDAFASATIPTIIIPDTVTTIGTRAFITTAGSVSTIQLPKNSTFTSITKSLFVGATNVTIIVPNTITDGFSTSNFSDAENITLNFECSEENAPSGVATLVSSGIVVAVNYNYQIES